MPGPPPKDPAIRQRRNKTTTRAILRKAPAARKRSLPARSPYGKAWHPATRRTWNDWWADPLAAEWTEVHVSRLLLTIALHEDFNRATSAKERKEAAAEIRLQEREFGLTPWAERSLQLERIHAEDEQSKKAAAAPPVRPPSGDPRLTIVRGA
ncbi:MAG TPA: hypothetical protein VGQ64_01875 [Candidatus Limnocylindrales bacterium]|nr:hypothetical protein [Candidatus Limnocylindrales bacterium]